MPLALGTTRFEDLMLVGGAIGRVLAENRDVLLLTTSDLNHYEDDATTRMKDAKAIEQLLKMDARGLHLMFARKKRDFHVRVGARRSHASTALTALNATKAELVALRDVRRYLGRSLEAVVGYAGMIFFW